MKEEKRNFKRVIFQGSKRLRRQEESQMERGVCVEAKKP